MGRIQRFVVFSVALAAASFASHAFADSRIFSVRSSQPGVAIEEALQGGKPLRVVGRGDGTTLFRLDGGTAAVPCANHLTFVTSDDRRVDFAADFCVLNWDITVDVKTAASPKPSAASPKPATAPAAPSRPASPEKQTVTIQTDDPAVGIEEVSIDGQLASIAEQMDNTVKIKVDGPLGAKCQRYLGVVLSDGRSIGMPANICENNGTVIVALKAPVGPKEPAPPSKATAAAPPPAKPTTPPPAAPMADAPEEEPPPPPPGAQPSPPSPTVATPSAPNAPPTTPGAPPPEESASLALPPSPTPTLPPGAPPAPKIWSFAGRGDAASISYGVPETDDVGFEASCKRGTSKVQVVLPPATPPVNAGAPVSVTFSAGGFRKNYSGVGSPVSDEDGVSRPQIEVPAGDPLWQAIIGGTELTVAVLPRPPSLISLKGSAAPTRRFLGECLPAVEVAATGGVVGPIGRRFTVNYSCNDGSALRIAFDSGPTTALLSEPGQPVVLLQRTRGPDGTHFVAGPSRLIGKDEAIRWSRFGERPRICRPVVG